MHKKTHWKHKHKFKKHNQMETNGLKCHHHWDETYWVNMFPDFTSAMTSWGKRWLSYSEGIRLFIVCKQLSIHQRQRHSVALVTAYSPTPSYDMIQQDLMGQMCVIINGMWVHKGVCDEFSPLMRITSFLWQRCMKEKLNGQMEKHGGEEQTWDGRSCRSRKAKRK